MKIKMCILSLIALFITGISRAEEMCVTSGLNFIVLHTNVDGEEPYVDADNKRFSITFNSETPNYHRIITGIASCNEIHTKNGTESGDVVTQNYVETRLHATTSDEGLYCWCKMEPVNSTDTTHFPTKVGVASYWQYLKEYDTEALCKTNCTTDCANAIANDTNDFRTVMFNSIW